MTTLLPQDSDHNIIPALRLKKDGAHTLAVVKSSVRTATAFDGDTRIVSLYANVPVFVAFGDGAATATTSDHYFPAGVYYDLSIGGGNTGQYSHVAVLAVSGGGDVYLSEKE
jgi:hypothetical protein